MTTQQVIGNMADWLRSTVCSREQGKRAALYEQAAAEDYAYTLVHPAVYESCFPANAAEWDSDAPERHPIVAPALVLSTAGESTLDTAHGRIETPLRLLVQTWNPGRHAKDADGNPVFAVDAGGWRDVACLVDRLVSELANAELPGGMLVTGDIRYELPDVEENEFYPYYRASVDFFVSYARILKPKFNI